MAFQEFIPTKAEAKPSARKKSTYDKATLKVKRGLVTLGLDTDYLEEKGIINLLSGVSIWFDPETKTIKLVPKADSPIKPQTSGRGFDLPLNKLLRHYYLTAEKTAFNIDISINPEDESLLICLDDLLLERPRLADKILKRIVSTHAEH